MPSSRPLTALRTILTTAALATLLGVVAPTSFADKVDQTFTLNGTATATVTEADDVATVGFVVSAGTGRKLAFTVKPAAKSTLKLGEIKILQPDGTVVDPTTLTGGSVKASEKSFVAKLPDTAKSGLWRVEVRGAAGTTGAFTCTVKGKDTTTVATTTGLVPANGALTSAAFDVGADQAITVSVKKSGTSTIVPRIQILDPYGAVVQNGDYLGVTNTKAGSVTLKAYRLGTSGQYMLRISGVDNKGGTVSYSVKTAAAKIKGALPVAKAGSTIEAEPGATTMLDGTTSTPVGTGQLAFTWVQVAGTSVALNNPRAAAPTFTAPATAGTLAFELSVNQDGKLSKSATVAVEVGNRPIADAGVPQSVATASTVTLDASASKDRRGRGLRYRWTQEATDPVKVTLSSANAAQPTFTAPNATATLHFSLVVDDGATTSNEARVVVVAGDPARAIADAGRNQIVRRMSTVTLSGLATRTASGLLDGTFAWTQISGAPVTLNGATSAFPSFTAPKVNADLIFEVTANGDATTKDRVHVAVRGAETNLVPVTNVTGPVEAASGTVNVSAAVTSSDPNNDTLSFRWAQVAGDALPANDPGANTIALNLPAGNKQYTYAVIANDGLANGGPDVVVVRNTGYAGAPEADAGADRTTTPGVLVTLNGSGSRLTQGSGPLTYRWRQISATDWFDVDAAVPGFNPAAQSPSFTIPTDLSSLTNRRTIAFELIVNDGTADSAPDFVTVTCTGLPINGKPTISLQASSTNPIVGELVTLDATTLDRDNDPVTIAWSQTAGATVALASPSPTQRTFIAPTSGTLTFQAVASDGIEQSTPATVTITVDRAPIAAAQISPGTGVAGTLVTVTSTGSTDPEGQPITYTWTQTAGTSVVIPTNGTTPSFSYNSPVGSTTIRLIVNDGRQNSAPAFVTFTEGNPISTNLTADKTSVAYGGTATLSANGVGTGISYTWRQIKAGATVNDPTITFVGPTSGSSATTIGVKLPPSSTAYGTAPSATIGLVATNGTTTTTEQTVKISFFASLANKAGDSTVATADTVYNGISNGCTSCHSGTKNTCPVGSGANASGFGMGGSASSFRTNSLNVGSCATGKSRIASSSSSGSYLYDRVTGAASPIMNGLNATQTALLKDWIDQGALDN